MTKRKLSRLAAAAALVATLIPTSPGIASGGLDAAWAAESSIPGLYAVSELLPGEHFFRGLELDPETGHLWFSDGGVVRAIDHAGNETAAIEVSGSGSGQLGGPQSLAITGGEVYVAERNNDRIQVFDQDGNHLRMWGAQGAGVGELGGPCGIEVVGNRVYVAEVDNDRIQVFNKDNGAYINDFASLGSGDGQISLTCGADLLTHHAGELFVADYNNGRVSVFDLEGNWDRHFGTFTGPVGIDAQDDGTIWVSDWLDDEVTAWTPAGQFVDKFGAEGSALGALDGNHGIVVDPSGDTIWVADLTNQRIQPFTVSLCAGKTLTHVTTSYPDMLTTGDGNDVVRLGKGNDTFNGGGGDDTACGSAGADTMHGGPGDDFLSGEKGNDMLYGDGGHDTLKGVTGNDKLFGGPGGDLVEGGTGRDVGHGGAGNDTVNGLAGNDKVFGDKGSDKVNGGDGADTANGGGGNDTVKGNAGNDKVNGNAGNDGLFGGPGTDVCKGNTGTDTATGCETTFGVP